jgi:hypothetical protein
MNSENNGFMMGDPVNNRWSLWKAIMAAQAGTPPDYCPRPHQAFSAIMPIQQSSISGLGPMAKNFHSSNAGANWTAQASAGIAVTAVIWFNTRNNGMAGLFNYIYK